jgi:hypothetical protein
MKRHPCANDLHRKDKPPHCLNYRKKRYRWRTALLHSFLAYLSLALALSHVVLKLDVQYMDDQTNSDVIILI